MSRAGNDMAVFDLILTTICLEYSIKRSDLRSKSQRQEYVTPRHLAIWMTKQLTTYSLPMIGRLFGGRHHTTVLHSIATVNRGLGSDAQYVLLVRRILHRVCEERDKLLATTTGIDPQRARIMELVERVKTPRDQLIPREITQLVIDMRDLLVILVEDRLYRG